MSRDFTYIDDLVEVFKRIIPLEPNIDKDEPVCHRTLNVEIQV